MVKYICHVDRYRCATVLYLFSMLSHAFNIIIEHGISASGHIREILYGMNDIDKSFISHLLDIVQLPGSQKFDTQMEMHKTTHNTDVSLAQ